jgi:serine/threonine-protein kinase
VAPEQLRGDRVGVACDVYQLGTLLHELLCGATVFDAVGLTLGQFERRILEEVPDAPSVRAVRTSDATAQSHAAASPSALARDLRGDLDAIVALALRKPPRERYGSVEQLADDLRRYLEGRPVAAVRGQRWYPLRKFLRRNALAVGATTAAVLLVGAFVTALWVQSQRIASERDRAELVAQFLGDVFKGADPADPLSRDQSIGLVLDNARSRLVSQMAPDPGLQVQMLSTLAGVYVDLDDTRTAQDLLGNAEFILRDAPSVDPRIVLAHDLQSAQLQAHLGDHQRERDFANRALTLQRSLGDSPGKSWEARLLQADSTDARGTPADLEAMQSLLHELKNDPDVPQFDFAEELVRLGKRYANANSPAMAETFVRQGLTTLAATLPAPNPFVLDARQTEAALLELSQHRGEQGIKTMQDVLAITKSRDGEHSTAYAHSLMILGQTYSQMNQSDDAIAATQQACAFLAQGSLRNRLDLMNCSSILGREYERMDGKLEFAAASYAEAESIATAISGEYGDDTRTFRADLGRVRGHQGRLDEAEHLLAASYQPPLPGSPPDDASIGIDFADVLHRLHRNGQASVTLDSVEPLLLKYPDQLRDEAAAAAQLRKAIAVDK